MRPPYKIGGLWFSISKACHCGAGVRRTPLRSRSTDRAGRRDRCKARGNPFSRPLVIANAVRRVAIRSFFKREYGFFRASAQNDTPLSYCTSVKDALSHRLVIAVRVSGGHLCEAEALTEPADETAARCAAIRYLAPSSLRTPSGVWQSVLFLKGNTDSFAQALRMTHHLVIAHL